MSPWINVFAIVRRFVEVLTILLSLGDMLFFPIKSTMTNKGHFGWRHVGQGHIGYANLREETLKLFELYAEEVRTGRFTEAQHAYSMLEGKLPKLRAALKK